ncbi:hypothetical protein HYS28_03360 [Candidatus Uhrbacteria bacterium]|nr:hypothetical protein [Candidatus Uhrbacteria bacterium]
MKKLLIGTLVVVAMLGAGCRGDEQGSGNVTTGEDGTVRAPEQAVEGAWYLAFDLPKDWVMIPHYNEDVAPAPSEDDVSTDLSDIVLQSTDKVVVLTGESELEEGSYVTDGYTYIRVFRMDKRSVVPGEAEDIGDGFFKLEKGVNLTYYFTGQGATYKFVVYQDEQEQATAEDVVLSAKEVTEFLPAAE